MDVFKRSRSRQRERGFTLVEVLVSVIVLSVGAVFVLQALAKISEVQNVIEAQGESYEVLISQMAEIEEDAALKENEGGSNSGRVSANRNVYRWEILSEVFDPEMMLKRVSLRVQSGLGRGADFRTLETLMPLAEEELAL